MFYALESTVPKQLFDGYRARIHHGQHITFALVEVEPNAALPAHSHANEQAGVVVQGEITLTVDGNKRTMRTGEGWVIPPNAVHDGVSGPVGAVLVECWSPPRQDFKTLPDAAISRLPECLARQLA